MRIMSPLAVAWRARTLWSRSTKWTVPGTVSACDKSAGEMVMIVMGCVASVKRIGEGVVSQGQDGTGLIYTSRITRQAGSLAQPRPIPTLISTWRGFDPGESLVSPNCTRRICPRKDSWRFWDATPVILAHKTEGMFRWEGVVPYPWEEMSPPYSTPVKRGQ